MSSEPGRRLDRIDFARRSRQNPSQAEQVLWQRLRMRQVHGRRFRRQHPIGRYFADFACVELKLVIEIDGDQHDAREVYDRSRDSALLRKGWQVLRFGTWDVLENLDGVMEVILDACQ